MRPVTYRLRTKEPTPLSLIPLQYVLKNLSTPHPAPQLCTHQKRTAQFPMKTIRLLGWGRQPFAHHQWDELAHPICYRLVSEVVHVWCSPAEWFCKGQD